MEPKRKRRRAKKRKAMVDPTPDTPENVIMALLRGPTRRAGEWRHERSEESDDTRQSDCDELR